MRVIHIKKYESYVITTQDERIKIWTKEDPFDGKATDRIEGDLLIAPNLAKKNGGWADICIFKDSSTKFGDLVLQVPLKYEGISRGAAAKGYHYCHFTITRDLFSRAIFGIGNDEEIINMHCHKAEEPSKKDNAEKVDPQDNAGKKGGADKPATATESKPEGKENHKPESKAAPR